MSSKSVLIGGREFVESDKGPYAPCETGVHVCGKDEQANAFYTALNLPTADKETARALYLALEWRFKNVGEEPQDFVVDLMIDGNSTGQDFGMSHQQFGAMKQEILEPTHD